MAIRPSWTHLLCGVVLCSVAACGVELLTGDNTVALTGVTEVVVDADGPSSPWMKALGDLTGDGKLDLIVGGASGPLVWYRYPDWRKVVIDAGGPAASSTDATAGDIDGDGATDVLLASGEWFRNPAGDGGDPVTDGWTKQTVDTSSGHDIHIVDLTRDGDTKPDVVKRDQRSGGTAIRIFQQTTTGAWTGKTLTDVPSGEGLAAGDINGDGYPDLVIGRYWYENPDGDIIAGAWNRHTYTDSYTFEHVVVAVADLNADGRLDIALSPADWSASSSHSLSVFLAPTDATKAFGRHDVATGLQAYNHSLQLADFDGDGRPDVVTAEMHQGSGSNQVLVYLNQGGGTSWSAPEVLSNDPAHNLQAGDVDGDGDIDLFGAEWSGDDRVRLWRNGSGVTPPPGGLTLDAWSYIHADDSRGGTYFGLAMGDFTGDGYAEIASGPYVYRNPGGDMTGSWTRYELPMSDLDALLAVDVDGDAFGDLIAMDNSGDLYWLEATDAQGSQWAPTKVGTVDDADHGISTQGYAAGQIIAGGKDEIVINVGPIYYFRIPSDPGAGSWPRTSIASAADPEGVALGDVDGDGDLDLVGPAAPTTVAWWENPGNGQGDWSRHTVGSTPSQWADRFELADFDGDGRLDVAVAVANGAENGVYWFRGPSNPKTGSWTRTKVAGLGSTNSMDVADMDGDGDPDILAGEHRGSLRTLIYENVDNAASWIAHEVAPRKESHLGARAFDLDGDGDRDIVSIAWDAPKDLHIWRNEAIEGRNPPPAPDAGSPPPPTPDAGNPPPPTPDAGNPPPPTPDAGNPPAADGAVAPVPSTDGGLTGADGGAAGSLGVPGGDTAHDGGSTDSPARGRDAAGGRINGGCSNAGGAGAGAPAVILLLLLVVALRRRGASPSTPRPAPAASSPTATATAPHKH